MAGMMTAMLVNLISAVAREEWISCENGTPDEPYELYEFRNNDYL
jgi:hypothetical protein